MVLVIFVGSIASGKTTVARALKGILLNKGVEVKYVDININHGFAYLITRLIVFLLKYKYVGNHYLTLRFNNEVFFSKYLPLMQILDVLYMPIKYIAGVKAFTLFNKIRKREYVVLLDEYYLNSIIDYLYFSELCDRLYEPSRFGIAINKIFYNLAFRLVLLSLKKDEILIVHMNKISDESVKGWLIREKTSLVDMKHVAFRSVATKVVINVLKRYVKNNVHFKHYVVKDFAGTSKAIIKDVLSFVG